MAVLDHWHAVLKSDKLKSLPVKVRVAGEDIALFRTNSGRIGALDNVCVHRRMDLSLGKVVNDHLQCYYHGWKYDPDGFGESPSTPRMRCKTRSFDVREALGLIWIRNRGAQTSFPTFEHVADCRWVHTFEHRMETPLELLLDNYNELEHTVLVHPGFGYRLDKIHEVEASYEAREKSLRVWHIGPAQPFSWLYRKFLGVGKDVNFHDTWIIHFSPILIFTDYRWLESDGGSESQMSMRLIQILTPEDDDVTFARTLTYISFRNPLFYRLLPLIRPILLREVKFQINRDQDVVEKIAVKDPSLDGLQLGRFDAPLRVARKYIAELYRGEPDGARVASRESSV